VMGPEDGTDLNIRAGIAVIGLLRRVAATFRNRARMALAFFSVDPPSNLLSIDDLYVDGDVKGLVSTLSVRGRMAVLASCYGIRRERCCCLL
jgi:hypothetical protein